MIVVPVEVVVINIAILLFTWLVISGRLRVVSPLVVAGWFRLAVRL
jgi:hypothetical protein